MVPYQQILIMQNNLEFIWDKMVTDINTKSIRDLSQTTQ